MIPSQKTPNLIISTFKTIFHQKNQSTKESAKKNLEVHNMSLFVCIEKEFEQEDRLANTKILDAEEASLLCEVPKKTENSKPELQIKDVEIVKEFEVLLENPVNVTTNTKKYGKVIPILAGIGGGGVAGGGTCAIIGGAFGGGIGAVVGLLGGPLGVGLGAGVGGSIGAGIGGTIGSVFAGITGGLGSNAIVGMLNKNIELQDEISKLISQKK